MDLWLTCIQSHSWCLCAPFQISFWGVQIWHPQTKMTSHTNTNGNLKNYLISNKCLIYIFKQNIGIDIYLTKYDKLKKKNDGSEIESFALLQWCELSIQTVSTYKQCLTHFFVCWCCTVYHSFTTLASFLHPLKLIQKLCKIGKANHNAQACQHHDYSSLIPMFD